MSKKVLSEDKLKKLQKDTFGYFLKETNTENGLVPDSTKENSPCSITAVGLALSCYPVAIENGLIERNEAVKRTLTTLKFFWQSPQGKDINAIGYKGFFYHFLDMKTGKRAWKSEVSTIDTTFFLAGVLACGQYFDKDTKDEKEIRTLADALYRRVDWHWALNGGDLVSMGWKPEKGFLRYRWEGYSEALILYVLALGSPTFPVSAKSYKAWTKSYRWKKLYDIEFLYAGPLFIHQLSHCWIDFRGITDEYMLSKGIDYFENSRRATYVQQKYAIRNPKNFAGYNENCWGITASDGPGPAELKINGKQQKFYDYKARSVPNGPDDGTIAPWAAVASLPFAPDIVLQAIEYINKEYPEMTHKYGLKCSFNPTFTGGNQGSNGWVSQGYYGLDQGPIVLMIENYRTGFFWKLMRECSYIAAGLQRAGFSGGWLD